MTWDQAYACLKQLKRGVVIEASRSGRLYKVERWFVSNGKEEIAHSVARKSIPVSWIRKSIDKLTTSRELRTQWFESNFYEGWDKGGCNFPAVGELFCLIGLAKRAQAGLHIRKVAPGAIS